MWYTPIYISEGIVLETTKTLMFHHFLIQIYQKTQTIVKKSDVRLFSLQASRNVKHIQKINTRLP